jgi:hypothetical protein
MWQNLLGKAMPQKVLFLPMIIIWPGFRIDYQFYDDSAARYGGIVASNTYGIY